MNRSRVVALTSASIAAMLALAGCASGSSGQSGGSAASAAPDTRDLSCANEIVHPDAPKVLVWAYFPGMAEVVDSYNNANDDVQVCWNNTGAGGDTYTKLNTALAAGTGEPDVVHLEYSILPSYMIQDVLTDLTEYGAEDMKDEFSTGVWADVSTKDGTFAIPVDGGPMGMLVRQDIFDQYGVEVPTTWDEFAEAGRELKEAGFPGYITNFPINGRQYLYTLMANAGAKPFTWNSDKPEEIGIELDTPDVEAVFEYWNTLVAEGVVSHFDRSSPEDNARLLDGTYAAYIAAAWGPGFLTGLTEGGIPEGTWRAVRVPHWDLSEPHESMWGGSGLAVTKKAVNQELSARVAKELFNTEEQWEVTISAGSLFPMWKPVLESEGFANREYPFFGGQQINKDVFLDAAAGYEGFTLTPFQTAVYDETNKTLSKMVEGQITAEQAAAELDAAITAYATQQGFTVK